MTNPIEQHQDRLEKVLELLRKGGLFSLSPEKRETLETEAGLLSRKLEDMEARYLTIGLVGGTGVGKSTLMNALAGESIASTSHRRPPYGQSPHLPACVNPADPAGPRGRAPAGDSASG